MLSGLILYVLAVAAVCIFRLSYLGWFGVFLFWLVVLLPPLTLLLSLPSMLSMKLGLSSPETVSCGEEAELSLVFKNARRLPVGHVRIRLEIDNLRTGIQSNFDYQFDAVGSSTGTVRIPSDTCGMLRIRARRWTCSDLIGVFHLKKASPHAVHCCILPLPEAPETAVENETLSESQPRMKPKYGGGFAEDHELRVYRPGDAMNSVHWKLSAKTGDLIVREALIPENDKTYVLLQKPTEDERGLKTLYWLSQELNALELPHVLVSDDLYPVTDDAGTVAALKSILSKRPCAPVRADLSDARRVFSVDGGEVSVC